MDHDTRILAIRVSVLREKGETMKKNGSYQQMKDQLERSRQSDVPLYRSYGVTRRHRFLLGKLENGLVTAAALWVLGLMLLAGSFALVSFLLYGQVLLVTAFYLLAGSVAAVIATKTLRKRLKFRRQLKKLCKKEGYRLEYRRGLFSSFFWEGDRIDFLLNTKTTLYEVRFLTLKKYHATLFFESEKELRYVTYPYRNPFTVIFNLHPKTRFYPLCHAPATVRGNRTAVKALLVNPVCGEMFYKDRDGSRVATGSGAELFGYTVFTATGFLETVKRRDSGRDPATEETVIAH